MEVHQDDNLPEQTDGSRPGRNGGTLQPWKPGQSGNPAGMKKGTLHFNTIMRNILAEEVVVSFNGKPVVLTRAQAIMLEKIRLATSSEHDAVRLRAIMDIEDRIDGRPVPVIPAAPDIDEEGLVFYIPNANSRRRKDQ